MFLNVLLKIVEAGVEVKQELGCGINVWFGLKLILLLLMIETSHPPVYRKVFEQAFRCGSVYLLLHNKPKKVSKLVYRHRTALTMCKFDRFFNHHLLFHWNSRLINLHQSIEAGVVFFRL